VTEILNKILPNYHFYNLGDRWIEARDLLKEKISNGKICLQNSILTDSIIKQFSEIKYDTPWEKYSPELRSLIAGASAEIFDIRNNTIVISSPLNDQVPKYKIFEFVSQLQLKKY